MSYVVEQHPELARRAWELMFAWIAYKGGQEYHFPPIPYSPADLQRSLIRGVSAQDTYLLSMLERHPREDDSDFTARSRRAVYPNHVAPIVRARVGHILGHEVDRPTLPWLELYLRDVDLAGHDRMSFLRRGELFAQIFGSAFCVTEVPATPAGVDIHSKADADAIGQRPYSQWLTPLDVINWDMDYRGEFNWIVLRYREQERARPGGFGQLRDESGRYQSRGKPTVRYRIWFRDHWEDWRQEADESGAAGAPTLQRQGPNPIGRVPVDVLCNLPNVDDNGPLGESAILGAAYINRTVYNLRSWAEDQCANQTFAQLAVPGAKGDEVKALQLGTTRYIGYNVQAGGGMPGYFAPPAEPTRLLLDVARELVQQLREVASMSRGRPDESIQPRSAEALAVERVDIEAELTQATAEAEAFEARNLRTVAQWAGENPDGIKVEYRKPEAKKPMVAVPAKGTESPGDEEEEEGEAKEKEAA